MRRAQPFVKVASTRRVSYISPTMPRSVEFQSTSKMVLDPKTGRYVEVHGIGALKGRLRIREGIDLTKPIFEQVLKQDALLEQNAFLADKPKR